MTQISVSESESGSSGGGGPVLSRGGCLMFAGGWSRELVFQKDAKESGSRGLLIRKTDESGRKTFGSAGAGDWPRLG